MSNTQKDQTEADWTSYFNRRYGSMITRRNTAIYTPIVQNMTIPITQYNDGTINPPEVVLKWQGGASSSEQPRNHHIHRSETSEDPFIGLDTNPNYAGDNYYFPAYQKNGVLFTYPEWPLKDQTRLKAPGEVRKIPLEIRRRLY